MEDLTTRLSPSSLRPVSFRYGITNGHTPTIFATTLTGRGIERSFVMMVFRKVGQDAIQSRVSGAFKRYTTNSVIENGFRLPNTDAAVDWRQRFISRRSNVGYSENLARYPLPKYSAKASAKTRGPACRDTTDAFGPAASRFFSRIVASKVVSVLNRLNTATQTRRNVDLSHVHTITQISEPRFSNLMLHCPCAFTQPNTQERMRGYMPFKMID